MKTANERITELEEIIKKSSASKTSEPELQIHKEIGIEDTTFEKNKWIFTFTELFLFVVFSILSFQYIQVMFGLWFGLACADLVYILLLLKDKYTLKGDSLGKVASHPLAVVGFWTVIAFVFIACFAIGNTLISDPARGEEHKQTVIERYNESKNPAPPVVDTTGFGNTRSSER